jgi:DNA-binding CsgD family transcriptional regulator
MDSEQRAWHELSDRLDTITRLLSYLVAIEHDTLEKRALVLSSLGLQPSEIARICGTTANTISVRLAEAKKKGKKKKKAKSH